VTRTCLIVIVLLVSSDGVAGPNSTAGEDARRSVAEGCAALATPTAPDEVVVKNELAAGMWSGSNGVKVAAPSDAHALGQMLRDLAKLDYNWAQLDAAAQLAAFQRYASKYKLTAPLTKQILKLAEDRDAPVVSGVLVLPCAGSAVPAPQQLSNEQQALYEYWNDAARKHCATLRTAWMRSRDAYARIIGAKSAPTTLAEYDAFVQVHADRSALAECKGDYWLHFLITPNLICDEKRPMERR
jgi:hypothetical protein